MNLMPAAVRGGGLLAVLLALCFPALASAAELADASSGTLPDLTGHTVGFLCIGLFVLAYALVIAEEWIHVRKSIPVLIAAGVIWALLAGVYGSYGDTHITEEALLHSLVEYAELFLFLLVAMTYINTLEERNVFDALHGWLVSRGFSLRTVFWLTGLLSFFISPIADNMTTAMVMASVAMAVGQRYPKFISLACVNIVVAANAGGAWSPFGDITTLMVWQKEKLDALQFLALLVPSVVNWLVPAVIMSFFVPNEVPAPESEVPVVKRGGYVVIVMFIGTIVMTISMHSFLHMPPVLGMMTGLGFLKLFGAWLAHKDRQGNRNGHFHGLVAEGGMTPDSAPEEATSEPFNIFHQVARAEWDTLLFFYGIILCVGGLGLIGYLALGSQVMYGDFGATAANVLVGVASAIIDNIPVMYAVLTMDPTMSDGQWLLVTLTAGVGGSLLSIGSAAGVAVMGQAHGFYTFFSHLRWTWAVALGYVASVLAHFWINAAAFH